MSVAELKPARERHFLAAWLVGSAFYMFLALEVVADAGIIAIPFQFIMGIIAGLIFTGVAALIGWSLDFPPLDRLWYFSFVPAAIIIACAILVVFFAPDWGFTITLTLPEEERTIHTIHPAAAYGSMLAAVFATLHFPRGRASHETV